MGACYSVQFKIRIEEGCEDRLFKELKNIIEMGDKEGKVNFNLDKVKQNGNNLETYLDLLKVFFSTCSKPAKDITIESDRCLSYNNDFDASYGWIDIMEYVIHTIAEYLDDYSHFYIEADNDSVIYVIADGKVYEFKPCTNDIDELDKKLSDPNNDEVKSDDDPIITKIKEND